MNTANKITLIGMPNSGKTTIGTALAKALAYDFIDLDSMVEQAENISLIEVMETKGAQYFRDMEYEFLQNILPDQKTVISPAGSIIYHQPAMDWITNHSLVIFLNTPFETIQARLEETPKAVANLKEQGLQSIWDERIPLYASFADIKIETRDKSTDEIVADIITVINK